MKLLGRKKIFTNKVINSATILEIINEAMNIHMGNAKEIDYLFNYEKGNQEILKRVKEVRPEINNRIVENHAHEIVDFKVGYCFGQPISFVQRASIDSDNQENMGDSLINKLNEMFFEQGKHYLDIELARNFIICGVGYRGIFQNNNENEMSDFKLVNLDPRKTFIIYSNDVFEKPLLGVTYFENENGYKEYLAYTDDCVYEVHENDNSVNVSVNGIGIIPIVEYVLDFSRMGLFERVIPLLEGINLCISDRLNGLAQFVQSLLWLNNVDIDEKNFTALKEVGGIKTSSRNGKNAQIQFLETTLNQTEIQTLADSMYMQVLQITGTPTRGSTGGGNTGVALMLGESGWQLAEENAQMTEMIFGIGERKMLEVVDNIIKRADNRELRSLSIRDIDIKFNRNKISNLMSKSQSLINLMNSGIHPRIAIKTVDLFTDPQQVYVDSLEYINKWLEKNLKEQSLEKNVKEQE